MERVAAAILIAVEDEFEQLKRQFDLTPEPDAGSGRTYHAFSFVDRTGAARKVVVRYFNSMGPNDAHSNTTELLSCYAPDLVISCGVSGALQNWIRLGDIVVGDAS